MLPNSPLNNSEENWLSQARAITLSDPPRPWGNRKVFGAAGISAGGWDSSNNFYLLSNDGYSRNDPISGQMLEFVNGFEAVYKNIHKDDLHFTIPTTGETINIFGIRAGDGLHVTQDSWVLGKYILGIQEKP